MDCDISTQNTTDKRSSFRESIYTHETTRKSSKFTERETL